VFSAGLIFNKVMTEIKTEAIILKAIPFKETSKIVRIYTKDKGKIAVIARGASRRKSDFKGKLDPLNHIEAIIYYKESREVQTLGELDLIKSYLSSCQNVEGVYYATAVLETLDKFISGIEDNQEIFQLTTGILNAIDQEPLAAQAQLVYYLLNLSVILGYRINLEQCSICQKSLQSGYYNTGVDHLICEACSHKNDVPVTSEEMNFFRKVIDTPVENVDWPKYSSVNFSGAGRFLLKYLAWHMEVSPILKSLKTLKDLKN